MDEINKKSDFLFYNSEDGNIKVQVIIGDESVWVTVRGMAEIFGIDRTGIARHIQNIYETNELQEAATCAKIAQVQIEGGREVTRTADFYNLDMIIAVGYRVSSYKATKFRMWATSVLKEFLIKGFALDDERLKQANNLFNKDYFKELLQRIRDIRASEKMFYEKVRELYATSVDYDKEAPETVAFFATVQNKLEYAVVGKTAAEIIKSRANAELPHMNLRTWKNVKKEGQVQKSDVTVAKNYIDEKELRELNTIVNMFLDYAELQAERNQLMKMKDWVSRLDAFLQFNDYKVLNSPGSIRKDVADKFAEVEYDKYKVAQLPKDIENFMSTVKKIKESGRFKQAEPPPSTKGTTAEEFDRHLKGMLNIPPPKK